MECFKCISICPSGCLEIDTEVSCVRLMEKSALKMYKERCTGCNMCVEVCPIGELALDTNDCSNCIICKNVPGCGIIQDVDRDTFLNSIKSFGHFIMLKIGFPVVSLITILNSI